MNLQNVLNLNLEKFENQTQKLSNQDLLIQFSSLVRTERKITQMILECIVEIDRRKIYLEKAYPSLFEFLVKEFGYSPSAAMRRIESARLLREIPEVSEKIKEGVINLSQLAKVQQTCRNVQKAQGAKVNTEIKKEILKKIENTSQAKTELILAQELDLPINSFELLEKQQIRKDESVTLTITFSKEQIAILEQAQNLVSHCVPEKKWAEVLTYLAEKEIKARSPKTKDIKKIVNYSLNDISDGMENSQNKSKNINNKTLEFSVLTTVNLRSESTEGPTLSKIAGKHLNNNFISNKTRKTILDPTKACCSYKDPITQKTCQSQRFLQMDHIQPKWAGGGNEAHNFQSLCAQHNKFRYLKQAGLLP